MKRNNFANSISKLLLFKIFTLFILLVAGNRSVAQCLVSTLDISTASGGYPMTTLFPGATDPNWLIAARDGVWGTSTGLPINATVVNRPPAWSINAGWISDNQTHANPGIPLATLGWPFPPAINATTGYSMTFRRYFRTCEEADITFNISILNDNVVKQISVDGTLITVAGIPQLYNVNNITVPFVVPTFTIHIPKGVHYFDVRIEQVDMPNPAIDNNCVGMDLLGNISAVHSVILDDWNPACNQFECPGCSDNCYWKVEGNHILNGNNIFGTLTNHDIRIVTNSPTPSNPANFGLDRGIITNDGLFGWNLNTTNRPTAYLDINCAGNNPTPLTPNTSDVRFRALESTVNNTLPALVIDPVTGYVYNSNTAPGGTPVNAWDLTGNTITGQNWLGTRNNDDIRMFTNTGTNAPTGTPRMVIKGSPSNNTDPLQGFVGINTPAPTARLHVDCGTNGGGTNGNGSPANTLSDIRFQDLEVSNSELKLLGIDANGYVYNTNKPYPTFTYPTSWDYNGNAAPTNSIFGITGITGQDIDIQTDGASRGVIEHDGDLGWHLGGTMPTTNLHVDAANPVDPVPSGIRFEHLQAGDGELMVIDADGYVLNSRVKISDLMNGGGSDDGLMVAKVKELEKEVAELKKALNAAMSDKITPENANELYQNNPNPFGTETSIGFNIVKMEQSAFIAIYDLNGRELYRYLVSKKGKGSVVVSGEKLVPGQYLYSLIVDGREEVTKKMVVSK